MILSKQEALEKLDDPLFCEAYDERRWCIDYRLVFKHEGKLWETTFARGTGDDGQTPWEYETEVECVEVEAFERTVIDYRKVS